MSQHQLSASQILEAPDLAFEDVPVPEWPVDGQPGIVRIQQLCAEEAIDLTDEMATVGGAKDGMYLMLLRCARNLDGTPLFSVDQLPLLKKKNIKVLNRLQRVALRLNAFDDATEVALKKD